jgi:hypothetical protein
LSDGLRKDANCYDSFARFVGNYEKDMKTDDDRLLFLAGRSFPDLSPPYPTLFMTLTLGLGASSIQGFLRRPSRPRSAFANASTLPTNVDRPDDLSPAVNLSAAFQPPSTAKMACLPFQ